ncbi:MAG: hypothetical protein EBE86_011435 [Hormoscilla sp. GUM202]|nr:hypothetical protein [Hormoscilla sp. GUM202]
METEESYPGTEESFTSGALPVKQKTKFNTDANSLGESSCDTGCRCLVTYFYQIAGDRVPLWTICVSNFDRPKAVRDPPV